MIKIVAANYFIFNFFIYFVGFLIAVYLLITAYMRIKMHFWHTQPVFHIYNLKYWIRPPGIINALPPPVNKFVNLSNINMIEVPDVSANASADTSQICQFIRDYYIIHETASYKPSNPDILAYLQCSNYPSFFNIYRETKLPFMSDQEILGVVSTRVLNVSLKKGKNYLKFPVYYVDHLCVKPGHRKKGIAGELIQTFYYNASRVNPKINAYLFKREGKLNAIVPMVYYDTYSFDMTNYCSETLLLSSFPVIDIGISQLNLFISFVKEQMVHFDCVVLPDISNVLNLLKLGKIKIYGIFFQGDLIAVFVFRCLELYYGGKKAAECTTILSSSTTSTDILVGGFALAWAKLSQAVKCDIAIIENTAHSQSIITALTKNPSASCHFKSPTAFFLYNYAAYSVSNTKTLLFY
jgi:hypothetical protein